MECRLCLNIGNCGRKAPVLRFCHCGPAHERCVNVRRKEDPAGMGLQSVMVSPMWTCKSCRTLYRCKTPNEADKNVLQERARIWVERGFRCQQAFMGLIYFAFDAFCIGMQLSQDKPLTGAQGLIIALFTLATIVHCCCAYNCHLAANHPDVQKKLKDLIVAEYPVLPLQDA